MSDNIFPIYILVNEDEEDVCEAGFYPESDHAHGEAESSRYNEL